MNIVFTITARNYLSLALTLGDSLSIHDPKLLFYIYVVDGLDGIEVETLRHPILNVEGDPRLFSEANAFKYDVTEYCTSLKPAIFQTLFSDHKDCDLIYYLDPDVYVFNSLSEITDEFPEKSLFLSPHVNLCRVQDSNPVPDSRHLWEGIFNLGFCAVRRSNAGNLILEWWRNRLQANCYADHADGLHTDQKWMDYAPAYFNEDLKIVDHPGVNVAHWNLVEREIGQSGDTLLSNARHLIFFHFSGFDLSGKSLTRHVDIADQLYFHGLVREMAKSYQEKLQANFYQKYIGYNYKYNYYSDCSPVTKFHRRLFRVYSQDHAYFGNPFDIHDEFRVNIESAGLVDFSKEANQNYRANSVGNLANKIQTLNFVFKCLKKIIGIKMYCYLIKCMQRYARFESHIFLLKK